MRNKISQFNLYSRLLFLAFTLFFIGNLSAQDTTQYIVPGRTNSVEQQKKPYVILISADGFRYDLAMRYQAKNLLSLSNSGVEATSMQPSYPSLTFPNHYSIITGLYPSHHGIVDNRFYDENKKKIYKLGGKEVDNGEWYGGEPLWVLAEKQKMLSASFFWVGSEAAIENVRPTYYFRYSEAFATERRLEILQQWLELPEEKRPHFITFYFPEVDHEEHFYGVYSPEAEAAVQKLDTAIGQMNEMCAATGLPVNFIFVSDHGFANVDTFNTLSIPSIIDTSKFIISAGSTMIHLYAKNKSDVASTYEAIKKVEKNYTAYLSTNVPERWHYGKSDDKYNRIGDIILVADLSKVFWSRGRKNAATHGWDNYKQEMQATFYAWGPAFKQHYKINNFENVNVYPLIAYMLGLTYNFPIDGKLEVLKGILKGEE